MNSYRNIINHYVREICSPRSNIFIKQGRIERAQWKSEIVLSTYTDRLL